MGQVLERLMSAIDHPFKHAIPTGTISSLARAKGRHEFITILTGAVIAPFTDPLTRSSNMWLTARETSKGED
jgi:hypothetical protein